MVGDVSPTNKSSFLRDVVPQILAIIDAGGSHEDIIIAMRQGASRRSRFLGDLTQTAPNWTISSAFFDDTNGNAWSAKYLMLVMGVLISVCDYPLVFDQEIIGNFHGFRRNKEWLNERIKKTIQNVCRTLSPTIDIDEDDEFFMQACEYIISIYPIQERLRGADQRTKTNDGRAFEELVCARFIDAGFSAEHIGGSGDQGADIILRKSSLSYVVQCKDYDGPVGNAAVQQAIAAKIYHKTDYAVVCSAAGFARSAYYLASSTAVVLLQPNAIADLEALARWTD